MDRPPCWKPGTPCPNRCAAAHYSRTIFNRTELQGPWSGWRLAGARLVSPSGVCTVQLATPAACIPFDLAKLGRLRPREALGTDFTLEPVDVRPGVPAVQMVGRSTRTRAMARLPHCCVPTSDLSAGGLKFPACPLCVTGRVVDAGFALLLPAWLTWHVLDADLLSLGAPDDVAIGRVLCGCGQGQQQE